MLMGCCGARRSSWVHFSPLFLRLVFIKSYHPANGFLFLRLAPLFREKVPPFPTVFRRAIQRSSREGLS